MSRTPADVKSLVTEIKRGFIELGNESRTFYNQIHFTKPYQDSLIANFAPEITTRIPVPSARLSNATVQTRGILRASRQFHVEAASKLKGDEGTADKLELFFAHAFGIRLDPNGRLFNDTYAYQCAGPFAAWCWEWEPFALPQEESQRQGYRDSYWPFRLSVIDPLTVAFLADDAGEPTIVVREFELPYLDLILRYGEYDKGGKDFQPLKIMGEQFPGLRGGRGQAIETNTDLFSNKARVCVLDDGVTICHYIEIKDGRQTSYDNLTKEVANPWGRPHIQIIPGRYNPEAERLTERYTGIMRDLGRSQKNVDSLTSQAASIALTPSLWVEKIPPEALASILDGDKTIPVVKLEEGRVTPVHGDVQAVGPQLLPPVIDMLLHSREERDALLPSTFLTNPDMSVIKDAAASAILMGHGTSNLFYDEPRESVLAAIKTGCKMMIHLIAGGQAKGNPSASGEGIAFLVTGKEVTKKYRGEEKGRDIVITPADVESFDEQYTLEVSIIASTASQKKANYDITRQEVADGANTLRGLIETTTEDVDGRVFEIQEETRYQTLAPIAAKLDLLSYIEWMRVSEGRDMSELAMAAGLLGGAGPETGEEPGQLQQDGNNNGYMMKAPATEVPDVSVTG